MKAKIVAVGALVIFSALTVRCQPFKRVSKEISKYEYRSGMRKIKKDRFHEVRLKLGKMGKLSFAANSDTLFLLESYNIENGDFYGLVWNRQDSVGYVYNNGSFKFDSHNSYTNYTRQLVQNWDTVAIRREEKMNSSMVTPGDIYATRVIKRKGSLEIDRIKFAEFFLLERDRFGWRDRGR